MKAEREQHPAELTKEKIKVRSIGRCAVGRILISLEFILIAAAPGLVSTEGDAAGPVSQVISWGSNPPPGIPTDLTNAASLSSRGGNAVALKSDGTIVRWGWGPSNAPIGLSNVIAVAAGWNHSMALRADGSIVAWGDGTTNSGVSPHFGQSIIPTDLTNVISIAAGGYHSMALKSDGTVVAWGYNFHGQTNVPPGLAGVVRITAGENHSLALKLDGTVVAWGYNLDGETNVPAGLTNVTAITAGAFHSVALRGDGSVVAWGAGTGPSEDYPHYRQCIVPADLTNVVDVAAGGYHTLALKANGTVVTWGANYAGQTNTPFGLSQATFVAGEWSSSFALTDGSPFFVSPLQDVNAYSGDGVYPAVSIQGLTPLQYQWLLNGTNVPGGTNEWLFWNPAQVTDSGNYTLQVSNPYGSAASSMVLTVIDSQPIFVQQPQDQEVCVRGNPTFAVNVTGSSPRNYQWRFNGTNIPGATYSSLTLSNVSLSNAGAYDVAVNNSFGTVISSNAMLTVVPTPIIAWGNNAAGQLDIPVVLTNALDVAAGPMHSLAIQNDTTVTAWGTYYDYIPPPVPSDLSNVVAIAAGWSHDLALQMDGTVVAWGNNAYGQTDVPTGLSNVISITAGFGHSLALKQDGTLAWWGTFYQSSVIPELSNIVAIASGPWHSLALRSNGTVVGIGDPYGENVIPGLSNIVAIAAGYSHSLALARDGTVVAWGVSYLAPVSVPEGLSNVIAISAGGAYFGDHSLALKSDGSVFAWGANSEGQTNVPQEAINVGYFSAGGNHNLALTGQGPFVSHAIATDLGRDSNSFSLSLLTRYGRVYALEYKDSLGDDHWNALPLVAGTGKTVQLQDPAAAGPRRFYRVRQW